MARKLGRPNTGKPFSATTEVKAQPKRIKKSRQDPSNAYTFIPALPKRHRTSEQTLSLTRDEALDAKESRRGRKKDEDEDSDEDMQARIRKVAMMIAQDDGGEVESEESDIDSDEAWEEDGSDEERWGEVFRDLNKGKKSKGKGKQEEEKTLKPKKPLTVNLDESEDEQTSKTSSKRPAAQMEVESDDDEDDEDEDEEDEEDETDQEDEEDDDENLDLDADEQDAEEDDEMDNSEDEEDSDLELPSDLSADEDEPDTLDGLDAFVSKLADGDKKRKSAHDVAEPAKKRRVLPVVSGPALGDNDLGLKSGAKVDLASLIASHPSLSGASSLLPSKSKKENADVLKQGVLAAPLPTVVQDRINREAAYEKTKEEGAKWSTLMKRVKEAEHLQFPLQGTDRGGVKSSGEILSEFKPQNKHESAVQALLAKANLTETGVKQSEDEALRGKELSMEEIEERRAALRAQRELMFREEAKAKRVSKIKSKTFRKLARKRAAKQGEADLEAMDEEELEERREKMERERARERATLKHSAKTGRWARDTNAGGEERQEARAEMFATKERLNRRIQGKGDGSESEESADDDEESGDEGDIRQNAFDQLAKVDEGGNEVPEKGLMSLKFMQKAEERKRQARKEEEAVLRADIEMFGGEDAQGSGDEDGEGKASMMKIGGTGGRMVFSGPQTNGHADASGAEPSYENHQAQSSRLESLRSPSPPRPAPAEANPWLSAPSTSGPSRKRNVALGANSSAADKASASLKKAKSAAAREDKVDDDAVDIETDGNKLLRQQEPDSDAEQDELLPRKKGVRFGQRDLVAEAFAGDNVVADFAAEKARIIEADAPKTEDTSLPGWGSWAGKGTKKRKTNPKFLKTTPGLLEAERKDAKFSNVIISEKKDKKASQYQVKDLPYPYTSVQQYEKRFDNPLGSEWNSRAGHQRGTLPRVTKKKGAIIEPVRRLF